MNSTDFVADLNRGLHPPILLIALVLAIVVAAMFFSCYLKDRETRIAAFKSLVFGSIATLVGFILFSGPYFAVSSQPKIAEVDDDGLYKPYLGYRSFEKSLRSKGYVVEKEDRPLEDSIILDGENDRAFRINKVDENGNPKKVDTPLPLCKISISHVDVDNSKLIYSMDCKGSFEESESFKLGEENFSNR